MSSKLCLFACHTTYCPQLTTIQKHDTCLSCFLLLVTDDLHEWVCAGVLWLTRNSSMRWTFLIVPSYSRSSLTLISGTKDLSTSARCVSMYLITGVSWDIWWNCNTGVCFFSAPFWWRNQTSCWAGRLDWDRGRIVRCRDCICSQTWKTQGGDPGHLQVLPWGWRWVTG